MGQSMITLYAEGMSTTINLVITILEQGSSLNVACRLMVPRGEIESLVKEVI